MMLVELFSKVAATSKSTEKIKLLKDFNCEKLILAANERLEDTLKFIYDPFINFNVTSSTIKITQNGKLNSFPTDLYQQVLDTQGRNNKLELITRTLKDYEPKVQQFFLAGLDKDLNIGISTKTINKVFRGLIPEFNIMLANKETKEDYEKTFKDLKLVYVNLKIDGIRLIAKVHATEKKVEFFTRDGKTANDFLIENIKKDIFDNWEMFKGMDLDGECYCAKFEKLMEVVNRKHIDANAIQVRNEVKFALFDIANIDKPLEGRLSILKAIPETKFITKLTYVKMVNEYELIKILAKKYIDEGKEGIIVKHPQSMYVGKRSKEWMKFKNVESEDLKVVGYYLGDQGGKYETILGGFKVDYNGVIVDVGGGYTDEQRKEFWEQRDSFIGKTMEVLFMERTHLGSLRHPRFFRWRTDK